MRYSITLLKKVCGGGCRYIQQRDIEEEIIHLLRYTTVELKLVVVTTVENV